MEEIKKIRIREPFWIKLLRLLVRPIAYFKWGYRIKNKYKVKKGLVVSGDQFINSPEKKQAIIDTHSDAMVTECEGAPIAQIANSFKVPFIIIRSVSDSSCENEIDTYEFNVKSASETSAKLVLSLIKML